MQRKAIDFLVQWKSKKKRKPLIIKGARQVGKTWLMKEFGISHYENVVYINFEKSTALKNVFLQDFDINRILFALEIESSKKITANNTLIILDEIQEVEKGITALKYFYEDAPDYHVIAAGSLLGIGIHKNTSFPVGKIDLLNLYPLDFIEFLNALEEKSLVELLQNPDWKLIKAFKHKFIDLLKIYYFTGGMPEVVQTYIDSKDFSEIRKVQNHLLMGYESDFSKHAPMTILQKIRMIWQALPAQLSKENKKFIYSAIKKGSRAKDFEEAISWLENSGLINKIHRVNKAGLPLKAYEDFNAFKLFLVDIGLLGAMSNLSAKTIINELKIFEEFKGAMSEQYVLQQMRNYLSEHIYYWSADKSRAEIDLIFQQGDIIYPVEVKAAENLQSKSLKAFHTKYPNTQPLRISMSDYRKENWLTNIPLYAVNTIFEKEKEQNVD